MMGEARRKLMDASKIVKVDLGAPDYLIGPIDREQLSKGPEGMVDESRAVPNATKLIIWTIIQCAFPQGMDRKDGQVWAAWQDVLGENEPVLEMPRSQLDWLRKHIGNEELKIPFAFAGWREELAGYLDRLVNADPDEASV